MSVDTDDLGLPGFIIRDLDKQPHSPVNQSKRSEAPQGSSQLMTPAHTPDHSPKMSGELPTGTTRSASDLSAHSGGMSADSAHSRNMSLGSQSSRVTAQFPFTNIFKWKRTVSTASTPSVLGLNTPPIEDGLSRSSEYFPDPRLKGVQITNLDNLGHSILNQKNELNNSLETQLQEERRLRHLAEDRLTEVEEEITRLCTVILPSDSGETGEAYFASIIDSVRIAMDSYEHRTEGLEKQLEVKSSLLIAERRDRTKADIECTALRNQLKAMRDEVLELQNKSASSTINDELSRENNELRDEVTRLRLEAATVADLKKKLHAELREAETTKQIASESSSKVTDREDTERAALLQRVKDTEAQRDALRQVSRGLRQRLTIETRKNTDRTKALAAIGDQTFTTRAQSRSHSRQESDPSLSPPSSGGAEFKARQHERSESTGRTVEGLSIGVRPRFDRFVTALEAPRSRMVTA